MLNDAVPLQRSLLLCEKNKKIISPVLRGQGKLKGELRASPRGVLPSGLVMSFVGHRSLGKTI